ncbi:MAG: rod shape-determining protein MreC, partial [Mycobacteriales bacterium]
MNRDSRRTRVVLALLVVTSFTLITLDFRAGKGGAFAGLRSAVSAVFGPIERAVADVVDPIGRGLSSLTHLGSYSGEVARLTKENQQLQLQLRNDAEVSREVAQLDGLLRLAGQAQDRVVPARVIALGGALGFDWVATIDAGSGDGVRVNMTVINGAGLVGRVKEVGPYTSQVLLAIDPQVTVAARLADNLQIGAVTGGGLGPMTFQAIDPTVHPKRGVQVVTFGSLYPPGIPIGTVSGIANTPGALAETALVRPYVDFTSLDLVGVVVAPSRSLPRGSLLPPVPTVTVTVTATPRPSPTSSPSSSAPSSTIPT